MAHCNTTPPAVCVRQPDGLSLLLHDTVMIYASLLNKSLEEAPGGELIQNGSHFFQQSEFFTYNGEDACYVLMLHVFYNDVRHGTYIMLHMVYIVILYMLYNFVIRII